jgi:periplasmic protein TonB
METKALVFRTWDDLVFATRNKAYGAYVIRKDYSRRLLLGLGVTVALTGSLLLLPGMFENEKIVKVISPLPPDDGHVFSLPPPLVRPPVAPPPAPSRTQTQRTNTTIVVVTQPVDPPSQEEFTEPSEPGTATGNYAGVDTGTGVATELPVVAPPQPEFVLGAEVMPVYEGGMEELMKFVKKKLRYPASARRMGVDGTVYVSFVVNGDGTVSHVSVLRGIHRECDEEAMRVISLLPGWIGGKQGGSPVNVKMVLPIKFALQ